MLVFPCAPWWPRSIHRLQFQEMQWPHHYDKETPVLYHLLPALTCTDLLNIHLIMGQETSLENMHREFIENCWLMSCTGSWKFNTELSHCKKGTEPRSQKGSGQDNQDILFSPLDQPFAWKKPTSPQNRACQVGSLAKANFLQCESHKS